LVECQLERDAATAGVELVLERPLVFEQGFRTHLVHGVVDVPKPQISLGQGPMQRLRGRHRDQALLVGAAKENGNPHQLGPSPIRLISQCNSIPEFCLTRSRTVSPSVSMSCPVALPVLMRKLQCISDTCAPPTRKPRQPAASISFQALLPGGFLKVDPPVFSRI